MKAHDKKVAAKKNAVKELKTQAKTEAKKIEAKKHNATIVCKAVNNNAKEEKKAKVEKK